MTTSKRISKKACANCAHAMQHDVPDHLFCIRFPAVPVPLNGTVISFFPTMLPWGKCDEFHQGKPQVQNMREAAA